MKFLISRLVKIKKKIFLKFLRYKQYDDPYNIELRHYYLIELILNEKWNEIFDILEETPFIHCDLIEFALKVMKRNIFLFCQIKI